MKARHNEYRLTEKEDLKYFWAAYRKGGLEELNIPFDLGIEDFKQFIGEVLVESGWTVWTLLTDEKPVGVLTGWVVGRQITMSKAIWFPWASDRNKWGTIVEFVDGMRKFAIDQTKDVNDPMRYPIILEFAHMDDKKLMERLSDKGLVRRVGTIYDIESEPVALFQSRSPVKGK